MRCAGVVFVALALSSLSGCDDDTGAPVDMSVGDMASPLDAGLDMPSPFDAAHVEPDLAGFCAGSRLDGTCALAFFTRFASCFYPVGSCSDTPHNLGDIYAWQDCAEYVTTLVPVSTGGAWSGDYRSTPAFSDRCLYTLKYPAPNVGITQFCAPGDPACTDSPDGGVAGGAIYDSRSGQFTCPDGTTVDIGADLGGCAELNQLLAADTLCDKRLPIGSFCSL